jgi:hypothetical protein
MKVLLVILTIFFSQFSFASINLVKTGYSSGTYYVQIWFNNWYGDYWNAYNTAQAKCKVYGKVVGSATYINYQNYSFIGQYKCK